MESSAKPSQSPSQTSIITAATHNINIKLTIENFLLWQAQIIPFLKGHQLYGYVDGSIPSPAPTLDGKPNPAYTQWLLQDQLWLLQDQLIVSTINSSLSESILAQVLECSTSHQFWSTLQSIFSAQSLAHVMHTKFQLTTL